MGSIKKYIFKRNSLKYQLVDFGVSMSIEKFFISNDGLYVLVWKADNSNIELYTLSSPFNLNTNSYHSVLNTGMSRIRGACLNLDGSKILAFGNNTNPSFYEWDLTTNYNLSTATNKTGYNNNTSSLGSTIGINCSTDGLYLYGVDYSANTLHKWSLSTPFDLSTLSHTESLVINELNNVGAWSVQVKDDGKTIWIYSTDFTESNSKIHTISLTVSNDLSTATYENERLHSSIFPFVSSSEFAIAYNGEYIFSRTGGYRICRVNLLTPFDLDTIDF